MVSFNPSVMRGCPVWFVCRKLATAADNSPSQCCSSLDNQAAWSELLCKNARSVVYRKNVNHLFEFLCQVGARGLILSPTRELALQTLKFTKEVGTS